MRKIRMHTEFWSGNLRVKDNFGDVDIDGRIVLRWDLKKIGREGMDWIHVAQDKVQWWTLVN
jgi:hypothetical protein